MPSPFPGMDPYLEAPAHWPDVHQRLVTYVADALQPLIRPTYRARIEERLYVEASSRSIYPDVTITGQTSGQVREVATWAPIASAERADPAYRLETALDDPRREPYVEIVQRAGDVVVTVIEVLSPRNKQPGPGKRLYLRKQAEVLAGTAHLVEMDLLAAGDHTVAVPPESLALLPPWRYLVAVNRHPERHTYEVYPFTLADRLPRVAVPLLAPDPDAVLDLPAVFAQCYDNGGYGDDVDYGRPPEAPLSAEESGVVRRVLAVRAGGSASAPATDVE